VQRYLSLKFLGQLLPNFINVDACKQSFLIDGGT
jgi:hypothetical protein